jgi:transposase
MRRVHLRRHPNILKRLLVHVAAFNLGLVMRKLLGRGTPRGLQGYDAALFFILLRLLRAVGAPPVAWKEYADSPKPFEPLRSLPEPSNNALLTAKKKTVSTTGC